MMLEGKTALITGAGNGIGRAMAIRFALEGATVIACDIDAAALANLESSIGCKTIVGDISTEEGRAAIADAGPLNILVNNAGILDALTPLDATGDALWDKVMDVNITAPFKICRAIVPKMIEAGGGVIVNTCSAASLSGGRAGCAYTASKHALLGLTRSIAFYYRSKGIRCNAVAPGAIQTELHTRNRYHKGGLAAYSPYFPMIGQFGEAEQVAEAALFLASDLSSYVNGEVISVDGGWNAF